MSRFEEIARQLHPPPASLTQASVAAFMEQGYLARHVRRMRQLYRERRAALADALQERVGAHVVIERPPGGLHLLARLPSRTDDVALATGLERQGFGPSPLSACGVDRPCTPGLVIGFANIEAQRALAVARSLARAIN